MIDLKNLSPESQKRVEERIGELIDAGRDQVQQSIGDHLPAVREALKQAVLRPGCEVRITLKNVEQALFYQAWLEDLLEQLSALDKPLTSFCWLELTNGSCILLGLESKPDDGKADQKGSKKKKARRHSKGSRGKEGGDSRV